MYEKEMKLLRQLRQQGIFSKPFYADRLHSEEAFDSYEQFTQIPLMYKDDIRNSNPMDCSTVPVKDVYGFFSSSGTTGRRTFYA